MANKNEAKIKFTAETGEFNEAIKNSNNQLSELRAEFKLNETQMQATGRTVEGLQTAHKNLEAQLEAAQGKTEALSQKVKAAAQIYGENSTEASKLRTQLANAQTAEEKLRQAIDNCDKELQEQKNNLDDVQDSAKNAGDGFTVLKGVVADLASNAIQGAIGKISEFISYLSDLPAATMELRQDMATLTTSFDEAGHTTEQATNTWKELYKVFGEDDRAVEAANNISKMADSQEELNDWVTITTGVFGTYQDSLPVEALAESANETAKTGTVTGNLADALNWSSEAAVMFADYMGGDVVTAEDAFNVALAECTTEQERQALITDTLTTLYGGAAATYRDTAGAQMEAKEAAAEQLIAENNLATAIEPVTTAFTELKTQLLNYFAPAIETVSNAMVSALEWAREHPVAMKAIGAAVAVLAAGLTGLSIGLGIYTAAQWLANSAMLAAAAPILGVVAAIAAVVAIIVVVIEYWDEIVVALKAAWEQIKIVFAQWGAWINTNVIQPIASFFKGLWDGLKNTAITVWDGIKTFFTSIPTWFNTNIIQPIVKLFTGLWTSIKEIWNTISNVVRIAILTIGSIISAAFQIITLPFRFIWENTKQIVFAAWEWIKNAISTAINAVSSTIRSVMTTIQNVFSTIWNAIRSVISSVWNSISGTVSSVINAISTRISTVFNAIRSTITSMMNAIRAVVSNVWNGIKNTTTSVWNAIRTAVTTVVNGVRSTISNVFNAIRTAVTSVWNGIKSVTTSVWNGIRSSVSSVVNGIRSTVSSVFNGIKSTVTSIWNGIRNAITSPIEKAKNTISGIVDTIKGLFSGMKLSFPDIKTPHFSIKPKGWKIGDLLEGSIPKLGIEWYKEGAIFTRPTIFGMNGNNAMVGGEAGPEAMLPIDKLEGYVANAVEKTMNVVNLESLANSIEDLANRPIVLNVNDREIAVATASASDNVNGLRSTFKNRGLVVE